MMFKLCRRVDRHLRLLPRYSRNLTSAFVASVNEGIATKENSGINPSLSRAAETPDNGIFNDRREGIKFRVKHPWPEWLTLLEELLKRGYMGAEGNVTDKGWYLRDSNCIRTACLSFARDRPSLLRHLSKKDIRVVAGIGCPSLDRKVVNSGKRLRAHLGIEEGNVCGACNLRGNCERAYFMPREGDSGSTVDVMRILLTYGLDSGSGTVENRSCQNEVVIESVRRLLREMLERSSEEPESDLLISKSNNARPSTSDKYGDTKVSTEQGDWRCPKCLFLNFARNLKCLRCETFNDEKLKQLKEESDHLPLKKGDWICDTCNFLNFAKNTRCLRCDEKPSMRQINPGEWECQSCNYINFRRNTVCLKCDHRRPKASSSPKLFRLASRSGSYENHDPEFPMFYEQENGRKNVAVCAPGTWRFVEYDWQKGETSIARDCQFLDFPIEGGKSALSQSTKRREEWKQRMLEKKLSWCKTKEHEDKTVLSAYSRRKIELLDDDDDDEDEMAEWFKQRREVNH